MTITIIIIIIMIIIIIKRARAYDKFNRLCGLLRLLLCDQV
jgi:hypothetical protein